MDIDVSKTKVMLFGGHSEKLNIRIKDTFVDNRQQLQIPWCILVF